MPPGKSVKNSCVGWLPLGLLCLMAIPTFAQSPSPHVIDPPQEITSLLRSYCFDCHGDDAHEGDFSLDQLIGGVTASTFTETEELASWQRVEKLLINRQMPPEGAEPLSSSARSSLRRWVSESITSAVRSHRPIERTTLRRMNNVEYANTMTDLLGVDVGFPSQLPADSRSSDGFVNDPGALLISSEHLQSYLNTARGALDKAIVSGPAPKSHHHIFTESNLVRWDQKASFSNRLGRNEIFIANIEDDYPNQGEFIIRVQLSAELPTKVGPPILQIEVGYRPDTQILFGKLAEVEIDRESSQVLEFRGRIENFPLPVRGQEKYPGMQIKLLNIYDDYSPRQEAIKNEKTGQRWSFADEPSLPHILIESVEFQSPVDPTWPPDHHRTILFESPLRDSSPATYVKDVLTAFVPLAFRRPVESSELKSFIDFYQDNCDRFPSFEAVMRETLAMVLVHPNFLYLHRFNGDEPQTIDDHQLATRLSYFLWSTMPDDELRAAADKHRLHETDELLRQVDRLLADERSLRWMTRFVDQWLKLDRLANVAADADHYPDFDPALKADMQAETQMFFRELVNEDLSAMNLIRSDFCVLNERMARHYGIANVLGREFRRVPIPIDSHRGGVLTHASVLMANSTGAKSHPVLRAVWVRDRLLNDPPGSPPADVPTLDQIDPKFAELGIRQQMEIHRNSDSCRECHRGLDPWGLALENFDAVGLWHEDSDSTAELPGGIQLRGINDLQEHLLQAYGDRFARSLVVRLTSYALGRQLDIDDRPMIEHLTAAFIENDCRIKDLVQDIVQTPEFQRY